MRVLIYNALVLSAAVFLTACSGTCNENKNSLPMAGFYYSGSESTSLVRIDSLEIVGVGIPNDSVLSPASESKSEIYLPFRIDSDTTSYVFIDAHRLSGVRDTVTFIYTRTPRVASIDCGVSYIFDMLSITSQGALIDSVTCPAGFIDNTGGQNLNIYFSY